MGKCIAIHPSIANRSNVIYIIIHRKTGCVYIGQTQQRLKSRILQHCNQHDQFIDRIIRAEGTDAFEVGVLDFCNSTNELNEREQFWIRYFNCTIPHGFNSKKLVFPLPGPVNCRQVLCIENNTVYKSASDAARQLGLSGSKISLVCNGKRHITGGLHFVFVNNPNDEAKKFIWKKRRVLCIETNVIYDSIADAAKQIGISSTMISKVCNGKNKTTHGLNFVFVDMPEEEWQTFTTRKRRVLCIESGMIYESITEAARQLNSQPTCIKKVCDGKQGTACGLHFRYADIPLEEQKQFEYKPDNRRKVRCLDTGIVYPSVTEASRQLGPNASNISAVCKGKFKSVRGLHFEYVD